MDNDEKNMELESDDPIGDAATAEAELDPLDFDDSEVETFEPLPETKEEVDEEPDSPPEDKAEESEDDGADEKSGDSSSERLEAVVDKAKGLGFTESELKGLDADQVAEAIEIYNKSMDEEKGEFEVDLDPDMYDEDVVNAIKGVHEHYGNKVSRLEEKIARLEAGMETSVREAAVARQDTFFADLGAGYKKVFGEGPTAYLDKDSDAFKNRDKLRREMLSLATGYAENNEPVPKERELFRRAIMTGFGEEFEKINATKLRDKFNKRTKISRPTQRGRTVVSGEEKAMNSVAQILQRAGIGDSHGASEVFE